MYFCRVNIGICSVNDGWELMLRQTVPHFASADDWISTKFSSDSCSDNYSILSQLDAPSQLKIVYPELTGELGGKNYFSFEQTSNPIKKEPAKFKFTEQNNVDGFHGLSWNGNQATIDGVNGDTWWYAIGSKDPYGAQKIPGPIIAGQGIPVTKVELWKKGKIKDFPDIILKLGCWF